MLPQCRYGFNNEYLDERMYAIEIEAAAVAKLAGVQVEEGHTDPVPQYAELAQDLKVYAASTTIATLVLQLVQALEINRVMAQDSEGNYTREVTPKIVSDAIKGGLAWLKINT